MLERGREHLVDRCLSPVAVGDHCAVPDDDSFDELGVLGASDDGCVSAGEAASGALLCVCGTPEVAFDEVADVLRKLAPGRACGRGAVLRPRSEDLRHAGRVREHTPVRDRFRDVIPA